MITIRNLSDVVILNSLCGARVSLTDFLCFVQLITGAKGPTASDGLWTLEKNIYRVIYSSLVG